MRVYFAGPLFTPYERAFIDECVARLRVEGIDVFVPLLGGPMFDDGSACEIGIFYALMQSDPSKKGIVGLLTDLRARMGHEGHGLNLFVLGCIEAAGQICGTLDEVVG